MRAPARRAFELGFSRHGRPSPDAATPLFDSGRRGAANDAHRRSGAVAGKASSILYAIAIAAFLQPRLAYRIHVLVALMWIIPDTRVARAVAGREAARVGREAAYAAPEVAETAREARRRARALSDVVNKGD